MYRNVASQKIRVYAYNVTTGLPVTGDAANITAVITKDDGTPAASNDTNPTEVDDTNEKGYYDFDMTQAESNAGKISFTPQSSTTNVVVYTVGGPVIYTRPRYFSLLTVQSDGNPLADDAISSSKISDSAVAKIGTVVAVGTIAASPAPTATSFRVAYSVVPLAGMPETGGYNDQLIRFTTGALTGQLRPILAYTKVDSTHADITLEEAFTTAPTSGDSFAIHAIHVHPVSQIADAIGETTVDEEAIAEAVWANSERTLTQPVIVGTVPSSTNLLVVHCGDSYSISITGLGDISNRSKLWFTVKSELDDTDNDAVLQITESGGLIRVNGEAPGSSSIASITVDNETLGNITIALDETLTRLLAIGELKFYDIQVLRSTGAVNTLVQGTLIANDDVTKAVS